MSADDDVERRAWAYLSRVAEPPCPRLTTLVAERGPVEVADMIRSGREEPDLTGSVAARREVDCAARDLETLDRRGGRLITPDDDEWPYLSFVAFANRAVTDRPSGYPPMVLWTLGPARLDDVAGRAAAIVGTRACTSYGEHVTAEIAAGLVERDAAVVSGGGLVL
jgi:DNA processing protein